MTALTAIFHLLVFPGFLFIIVLALAAQFMDRKLHARLQNRVGPPWFQPLADVIKLLGKERIIPADANRFFFIFMPPVALASVIAAIFYIPMWNERALFKFQGDLVVVIYLLTIPTLALFLGGWHSSSLFAVVGSIRAITQLFAYEIPFLLSLLGPAVLAGSWSLSEITHFYTYYPGLWLVNILGFWIALISMLGKLKKVPFDAPEAETEIVAGPLTEYSGSLLAFLRLTMDVEMVVGASLIAAVFLPFGLMVNPIVGFFVYLFKIAFIISLLCLFRTVFARLRIDQMIKFCWKFGAPAAFLQVLLDLLVKGFRLP